MLNVMYCLMMVLMLSVICLFVFFVFISVVGSFLFELKGLFVGMVIVNIVMVCVLFVVFKCVII